MASIEKICIVCETPFNTPYKNKKYCELKCRQKADRIKRRSGDPSHWNHGKKNFSDIPRPCKGCGIIIIPRSNNCQYCEECSKSRYKRYERNSRLKKTYNIDENMYNLMVEKQNFSCLIYKTPINKLSKKLVVDHYHETGKVRGLLCDSCNKGLGNFKDNPQLLDNAIKYLDESF